MTEDRPTCVATYYQDGAWRPIVCGRPAKVEAWRSESGFGGVRTWLPVCGIHARRHAQRPLGTQEDTT